MLSTNKVRLLNSGASGLRSTGFTLIEIMVALAVVAIGLLALSKAMTQSVDLADQLQLRTIANWVGSNRMAEIRMNRNFTSSGSNANQQRMAGRDWQVVDKYYETADPNIVRVIVEVYVESAEMPVSSNIGYLAKYKPAKK